MKKITIMNGTEVHATVQHCPYCEQVHSVDHMCLDKQDMMSQDDCYICLNCNITHTTNKDFVDELCTYCAASRLNDDDDLFKED